MQMIMFKVVIFTWFSFIKPIIVIIINLIIFVFVNSLIHLMVKAIKNVFS